MLFIPKKLNVGYRERSNTYSGKLAFVIYYDDKGILRKETSWQNWRDKNIKNDEFDNLPLSGFVLNKKVGGYMYRWNPRQTYTRVYDPRGFEVEITIPNLLYILENTNSIKGKGLEGDFVYGWDGTELTLIPVGAPDYKKCKDYSDSLYNVEYIKAKDLVEGRVYRFKDNRVATYMGKYNEFCYYTKKLSKKKFVFNRFGETSFFDYSSITEKLIAVENDGLIDNDFSNNVEILASKGYIKVFGSSSMVPLSLEKFKEYCFSKKVYTHIDYNEIYCYNSDGKRVIFFTDGKKGYQTTRPYYRTKGLFNLTIDEIYDIVKPHVFQYYTDKTKTTTVEVGYGT